MGKLVCIKSYINKVEAEIAKSVLEGNDIEAIISADDCGGMQPPLSMVTTGGVRLLVKEEDTQKALEVLEGSKEKDG